MSSYTRRVWSGAGCAAVVSAMVLLSTTVASGVTLTNLALNSARIGFPSPLSSDDGWGGGADKWDLNDGLLTYTDTWQNGLALWYGTGQRYVIDFGTPVEFDTVKMWWRTLAYTPSECQIDYWDSDSWHTIFYTADGHSHLTGVTADIPDVTDWYGEEAVYTFAPVTSSRVSFVCLATSPQHPWTNEMEVFNVSASAIPEPMTIGGVFVGVLAVGRYVRKRKATLQR